jgi:putative phosphoribosyl transferase
VSDELREQLVEAEQTELARRVATYRGARELPPLRGRDVVLVDDGLATGVTADAALRSIRRAEPSRLVLAVPVGARESIERLEPLAEVVCLAVPAHFRAVGLWYDEFSQVNDDEVKALLAA